MGKRTALRGAALLFPVAVGLSACAASAVDSSLTITNWLDSRGATCKKSGEYETTTVPAVPFTRVMCEGVQFDFFEPAAADRYDAFWAADCSATPQDQRAALEAVSVVRGPTWVLRGDASPEGAWPEAPLGSAGVTPEAAADELGGRQSTWGQVCRDLAAWSA